MSLSSYFGASLVTVSIVSFSGMALAQVPCDRWDQQSSWSKIIQPTDSNLYDVQQQELARARRSGRPVREAMKALNDQLLEALKSAPKSICSKASPIIKLEEANQVYQAAYDHPVASLDVIQEYDPKGGIGFCFGRAMTTHNIVNKRGLATDSTLKIWAVGRMVTPSITWGFHVTTIVRGPSAGGKAQWYAIDPIFSEAMPLEQWVNEEMAEFNSEGEVRFYVTPAEKFGPNTGRYSATAIADPFYNRYFDDWRKYNHAMGNQCEKPTETGVDISPYMCVPLANFPRGVAFNYNRKNVEILARRSRNLTRGVNRSLSFSPFVKANPEDKIGYSDFFREYMKWKKPEVKK